MGLSLVVAFSPQFHHLAEARIRLARAVQSENPPAPWDFTLLGIYLAKVTR